MRAGGAPGNKEPLGCGGWQAQWENDMAAWGKLLERSAGAIHAQVLRQTQSHST